MMNQKHIRRLGMVCLLASFLTGCGKVTGPISPLVNVPIQYTFDTSQSIIPWFVDSDNPSSIPLSEITCSWENTIVLQGTGAMEIQTPVSISSCAIGVNLSPPVDMTNKTLSVWVYWEAGLDNPSIGAGSQIFIKDSNYNWSNGSFFDLTRNHWTQVTFPANAPQYSTPNVSFLLTSVGEIGVQIAGSNGAIFTSPGIVYVDSFGY